MDQRVFPFRAAWRKRAGRLAITRLWIASLCLLIASLLVNGQLLAVACGEELSWTGRGTGESRPEVGNAQQEEGAKPATDEPTAAAGQDDTPMTPSPDKSPDKSPDTQVPDAVNPSQQQPAVALEDPLGPHRSRYRAIRGIRVAVIVVSAMLSMFSALILMRINRLSHGKYTGRLWWIGLIVIPGWLLVGTSVAWNNDLWVSWFDGKLL
jgi:hypothetical protein